MEAHDGVVSAACPLFNSYFQIGLGEQPKAIDLLVITSVADPSGDSICLLSFAFARAVFPPALSNLPLFNLPLLVLRNIIVLDESRAEIEGLCEGQLGRMLPRQQMQNK